MFILHKMSTVSCTMAVEDQCKGVGHDKYDYEVHLKTKEKLDERGFVIDHTDVHKLVQEIVNTQMASCEVLTRNIGKALKEKLDTLGVPVKTMTIRINPVNSNAHVTYYKKYKN
jgi:6-pyruvoyl-tetrahydropterin synthase